MISGKKPIEIRLLASTGKKKSLSSYSNLFVSQCRFNRSRPPSSTSPISSRRSRKQVPAYGTSRSESLERTGTSIGPLSQTDEDTARTRPPTKPKYDTLSKCCTCHYFSNFLIWLHCRPSVSQPTATHSTTMKKPASSGALSGNLSNDVFAFMQFTNCYNCNFLGESGSLVSTECTVVTFTFGDEPVPYRSRIPGRTVTLKQFKETCLPKKGNYK